MSRRAPLFLLTCLAALAGCATPPPLLWVEPPESRPPAVEPWREIATAAAADRINHMSIAWADALGQARWAGFGRAIAQEGALFDPKAAEDRPQPPPGRYQCRVIRLGFAPGEKHVRGKGFASFPPYFCWVDAEGALTTLVKETGSQRHAGRLWPDNDRRMIFLGALAVGDETAAPAYGANPGRDIPGVFERVDQFLWRLAIPWPQAGSTLEILELKPFIPDKLQ